MALYRIKPYVASQNWPVSNHIEKDYGMLWVDTGEIAPSTMGFTEPIKLYKSVATGEIKPFLDYQLEKII